MSHSEPEKEGPERYPGLPERLDLRRALDIYVRGRNRTLEPSEKGKAVGGRATRPFPLPSVMPAAPASVRIGVPRRLHFHRNAGTWRDDRPAQKQGESPDAKP